jgi:glutathione S-transferase
MTYTLYYSPGACSISPHAALREAGLPFELVRVDLRAKKTASGDDYLAINPKGYVPALRLPDGEMLTEAAVMLQYIADRVTTPVLAPSAGTMQRYRLQEWLNFIATELHKGMGPLYSPFANDEYKQALAERLALRWSRLADAVRERSFVMGELTIVDLYACYVLRAWQKTVKADFARWPELQTYYSRLVVLPSIAQALAAEGITA